MEMIQQTGTDLDSRRVCNRRAEDKHCAREGLMGVGDRVASVIMLTLQRCPAPMLTQLVWCPAPMLTLLTQFVWSPAPMLTQFVWSPAPHADTNLKLKQWNNLKYLCDEITNPILTIPILRGKLYDGKNCIFEIYQSYPCIALRVKTENLLL